MASIESRVVELKFQGQQFMEGAKRASESLKSLKQNMDLSGAAKGLDSVSEKISRFNFGGIGEKIKAAASNFGILDIAGGVALGNIASQAINTGLQLVKSLTIQPALDGLREYETQLNSVQTILANTKSKGTTIDDVNAALDELNKYADLTIYNFSEMTRNIGLFTAAGVSLEDSVSSIKGISNLAALSGSNSQQAATAMTQLSQAIAAGTVKLQDWNSVVNAGMGGEQFQNLLKDVARNYGTGVDEAIEKTGSFRESLKEGWLDAQVLTEALTILTGDLNEEQIQALGYTAEQAAAFRTLAQDALDSATKVKTFTQLIDTIKEAVGSGWAETFEIVLGNFDEASKLFTDIHQNISKVIDASSNARNNVLRDWKALGGRDSLIQTIYNLTNAIWKPISGMITGIKNAFSGNLGQGLYNLTKFLENLTARFVMSEWVLQRWIRIWTGIGSVFNIVYQLIKPVFVLISAVISVFTSAGDAIGGDLLSNLLAGTAVLADLITKFSQWLTKLDLAGKLAYYLATPVKKLRDFFDSLRGKLYDLIVYFASLKFVKSIGEWFKTAGEKVKGFFSGFSENKHVQAASEWLSKLGENAKKAGQKIKDSVTSWKVYQKAREWVTSLGESFQNKLDTTEFGRRLLSAKDRVVDFGKSLYRSIDWGGFGEGLSLAKSKAVELGNAIYAKLPIEEMKAKFNSAKEAVQDFASAKLDILSNKLSGLGLWFKEVGNKAYDFAAKILDVDNALTRPKGFDKFRVLYQGLVTLLSEKLHLGGFVEGLKDAKNSVVEFVKGIDFASKWDSVVSSVGSGIAKVKGFFSDLKNSSVGQAFSELGTEIKGLFTYIATNIDWDKVKKPFAEIGSAVKDLGTEAWNKAAGYIEKFTEALQKLKDKIQSVFGKKEESPAQAVASAGESTAQAAAESTSKLQKVIDLLKKWGEDIKRKAAEFGLTAENFKKAGEKLKQFWTDLTESFSQKFGSAKDIGRKFFDGLIESFKTGLSKLYDWLYNIDAGETIVDGALLGTWAFLLYKLKGIFSSAQNFLDSGSSAFESIGGAFETLTGHLKALTLQVKAKAILFIAGAVLALAGAMWVISTIDANKLQEVLFVMVSSMAALAAMVKLVAGFDPKKSVNFTTAALAMVGISLALVIMAGAMKALATMDTEELVRGSAAIVVLGVALGILTRVMSDVVAKMDKWGGTRMIATAIALVVTAGAIRLMAGAVQKLGEMDPGTLFKGIAAMTGILVAIGLFERIGNNKVKLGNALSLLIVSYAVSKIADVLVEISEKDTSQVIKGLTIMASALAIIAVAMRAMGKDALGKAAVMLVIVIFMQTLADKIQELADMSWGTIVKGLGTMAAALALLVVATRLMGTGGGAQGALAMIASAVALKLIGQTIEQLGNLPWQAVAVGIFGVAGVLTVLIVAGYAAQPVIPIIIALAAAVGILGIGLGLVGAGVGLLAVGLVMLASLGAAGVASLVLALTSMIALIPYAAQKFGEGMVVIAQIIADNRETWKDALSALIYAMLQAFIENVPYAEQLMSDLIDAALRIVRDKSPDIVATGWQLLLDFLKGIRDNITELINIGTDITLKFMDGIQRNMPKITNKGADLIITFVNSMANTIRQKTGELRNAGINLATAIIDGMTGGLASQAWRVASKMRNIASDVVSKAKNALGIKSPSRVFRKIGVHVGEGFVLGMDDMQGKVGDASEEMGKSSIKAMNDALQAASNSLEVSTDTTIRPVVDLSEVDSAVSQINNKFGQTPLNFTATAQAAQSVQNSAQPVAPADPNAYIQQPAPTYNYTQNNYSPEPLSALEIYNRTSSMLARMEERAR